MKLHPFLLLFLGIFPQLLLAQQTTDTTAQAQRGEKLNQFNYFTHQNFQTDTTLLSPIDTSLEDFYYYAPQMRNFKMNLGNNGTAQINLSPNDSLPIGLKTQFDQIDDFRFHTNTNRFYDLSQPYAKIFYINGAQREEGINIKFSQNVSPGWNTGIEYRKTGSEGFYQRQKTSHNNFGFFQSFRSKNNRYGALANFNYNDTYNEENGGIRYDSLFTDLPRAEQITRKSFEVNYLQAKNLSRSYGLGFRQFLNFGTRRIKYYKDENDSVYVDSIISEKILPRISFEHQVNYLKQELIFEDQDVQARNYVLGNLADTSSNIFDLTVVNTVDNQFGVILYPFPSHISSLSDVRLRLSSGIQYGEYAQHGIIDQQNRLLTDNYYNNWYGGVELRNSVYRKHQFHLQLKTVFAGHDQNDLIFKFKSLHQLGSWHFMPKLTLETLNPTLLEEEFASSAYQWNTSDQPLNKRNNLKLELNIHQPKLGFSIGGRYQALGNHIYFDALQKLNQYNSTITLSQIWLEQKFKLSVFHLDLKLQYQFVDQAGIINVPEFLSYNSFYIQHELFKKDMLMRIGVDLYYTTAYTGDGYNPVTRQFYSQTQTKLGEFPWLEAFLMVNVDRAYFFGKLSNVMEGIPNYNYFASPGYPLNDLAFKFGVKWEFVN
ncbi:hypothetical protein KFE98_10835 [bacterium SCSIO 12741]|nr:hypothetical protein KFE98_10835 [bacterium SCSIO 12741]